MFAISIQPVKLNDKDFIISLSVLHKEKDIFKIENFYWPQYITAIEELTLNHYESTKLLNSQCMIPMCKRQMELLNSSKLKEKFIITSRLNEKINNVKRYIEEKVKYYHIILHKDDVYKWLAMNILSDIAFERVSIINTENGISPICIKNELEHTTTTCTTCKCYNIYKRQKYWEYFYDNNKIPFLYWTYSKRILSKKQYNNLCNKMNKKYISLKYSSTPPMNRNARSKSMAPRHSPPPSSLNRNVRSTSIAPRKSSPPLVDRNSRSRSIAPRRSPSPPMNRNVRSTSVFV